MQYVLVRNEDGAFVAPSGSAASYVRSLQDARVFTSRESAQANACGNETVRSVSEAMRHGKG